MDRVIQKVIIQPVENFFVRLWNFLPNLFGFALILGIGIAAGIVLKGPLQRFFRIIKVDEFAERSGIARMLHKGGIREPASHLLAELSVWLIVVLVAVLALYSLNIPEINRILEQLIRYLPNVIVAAIIVVFGYILSNILGRAALITAVNAGVKVSGTVGRLVRLTVFILAITMALEQLGIGRETIVVAFAILFGGIVLALAIAFGLGGRDLAREYLEKKLKGKAEENDIDYL